MKPHSQPHRHQDWQLVPVEPTEEMISTFKEAFVLGFADKRMATEIYKAMLAAAPKEPT